MYVHENTSKSKSVWPIMEGNFILFYVTLGFEPKLEPVIAGNNSNISLWLDASYLRLKPSALRLSILAKSASFPLKARLMKALFASSVVLSGTHHA